MNDTPQIPTLSKHNPLEYALNLVQEEATELALAISKLKRFGLEAIDETSESRLSNLGKVRKEVLDLLAAIELLNRQAGFPLIPTTGPEQIAAKQAKVYSYQHKSIEAGLLSETLR